MSAPLPMPSWGRGTRNYKFTEKEKRHKVPWLQVLLGTFLNLGKGWGVTSQNQWYLT